MRIYLSPPDLTGDEYAALERALAGGWVAPLGPEVDAFEAELAAVTGRANGVALSSGTAAIHLALQHAGVGPGTRVLVQSLTFVASVNPVRYLGAEVVLVDSDEATWAIDPDLVGEAFDAAEREGRPYTALVTVDLYGECADYSTIVPLCERHGVTLIEDAAEALGSTHAGRPAGSFGHSAALSFNGNKIITTSGGGAMVTDDADAASRARFLATQARDPSPHYEHTVMGYNYRMSNLLAALGRAQLADLERRVERRRDHNAFYRQALGDLPGVRFMEEGAEQPDHVLADHVHRRPGGSRHRPRGHPAPPRVVGHRGPAGVEADAPAALVRRRRGVRRGGVFAAVRARVVHPVGVEPHRRPAHPGRRGDPLGVPSMNFPSPFGGGDRWRAPASGTTGEGEPERRSRPLRSGCHTSSPARAGHVPSAWSAASMSFRLIPSTKRMASR